MPCKEEMRGKIIDFFKTIPVLIKKCVQETQAVKKDGKKVEIDEDLAFKACVFAGYFALHSTCLTKRWEYKAYYDALTSLCITEKKIKSKIYNYTRGSDISADAVLGMREISDLQKYMEDFVEKKFTLKGNVAKNKTAIRFFTDKMWIGLNRIAKDL